MPDGTTPSIPVECSSVAPRVLSLTTRHCVAASHRRPLTLIFHGKPIGTCQVGRGRLAAGRFEVASGKAASAHLQKVPDTLHDGH